MNNYKVKSPFNLTIKTLDLKGRVQGPDTIEFLHVELQYEDGNGPLFLARVRYACNGVEQEDGFPIDLDKGAFIPTVSIQNEGLEEKLQEIGPKIAKIVREDLAKLDRTDRRGSRKKSRLSQHVQEPAETVVYGLDKDTHYVIQSDKGGWDVKRGGAAKSLRHFSTKGEAVKYGREVSRNQKTEFVIFHKNGKIHER